MGQNPEFLRFRRDFTLPETIRSLFDGDDRNAQDRRGNTVLHRYVYNNRYYHRVLQALISGGTNIEIRNHFLRTPFLLAIIHCNVFMIQEFISNGANVHTRDYLRQNALHYLAFPGKNHVNKMLDEPGEELRLDLTYRFFIILLENGVDVNLQNYQDFTPLMYAAVGNHLIIVEKLLKYGAKVYLTNILSKTCLHLAATPQDSNRKVWDRGNCTIVADLIRNGACVNCFDNDKKTPLGCILRSTHRNKDEFAKAFLMAASLFHWRRRIDFYILPNRVLGALRIEDSLMSYVTDCYQEIDRMRRFRISAESNLCHFALRDVSEAERGIASVVSDRVLYFLTREAFPIYIDFIVLGFELEYMQRKLMQITISSRRRPVVSLNEYINFRIASFLEVFDIYHVFIASW